MAHLARVAHTIIFGMRSMNSHLERITATTEELAETQRRPVLSVRRAVGRIH